MADPFLDTPRDEPGNIYDPYPDPYPIVGRDEPGGGRRIRVNKRVMRIRFENESETHVDIVIVPKEKREPIK